MRFDASSYLDQADRPGHYVLSEDSGLVSISRCCEAITDVDGGKILSLLCCVSATLGGYRLYHSRIPTPQGNNVPHWTVPVATAHSSPGRIPSSSRFYLGGYRLFRRFLHRRTQQSAFKRPTPQGNNAPHTGRCPWPTPRFTLLPAFLPRRMPSLSALLPGRIPSFSRMRCFPGRIPSFSRLFLFSRALMPRGNNASTCGRCPWLIAALYFLSAIFVCVGGYCRSTRVRFLGGFSSLSYISRRLSRV